MESLINNLYLDKNVIASKLEDMRDNKPVSYVYLDDFITPDFYRLCLNDIQQNNFQILSHDKTSNSQNKTVFIKWKNLLRLYDFFQSDIFEKYLSIFFWSELKREFYIDKNQYNKIGIKDNGCIWQLYQKWDYYGWHIDGSDTWISLWAFTYYLSWYTSNQKHDLFGWRLELWTGKWGDIHTYETLDPLQNRLVLILYRQDSFHRVTEVTSDDMTRISLQATLLKKD